MSDLTITFLLQSSAVITTFVSMWLIGNKSAAGPWWGQASNAAWSALYIYHGLFGLLIVPAAMIVLHARMSWKWRRA